MRKSLSLILTILIGISSAQATVQNGLRTMFLNNNANIYALNIRTFNAQDKNGNDIIDEDEESGNFINAIDRLDEIKDLGINTIHVLPITPVGKLKALGTAGSLYAARNFWSINPQLIDKKSDLSPEQQAKYFINECHARGIKVIIDLPSCGSYDLFLTNPELFLKDDKQCSIVPTDWTDVRLLNTGNNKKLNQDVLDTHKKFVDLVLSIDADGIRADVATIKPSKFWIEIINYARERNPEFMFLAEASDSWREPPSKYAEFTPYDKLLKSGFDGYYGSFFNLKEWNADEFMEHIKFNRKLLSSYKEPKSVILSFSTHDEVSPIILHGENFSKMICWLDATLPFNPYIVDGFQTGDKYLYKWENSAAKNSETDDDNYFVHRGKIDIFNFSRKPQGNNDIVLQNFKNAMKFRENNIQIIKNGNFNILKTSNNKVFAYTTIYNNEAIFVIGNLDFENKIERANIQNFGLNKKSNIDVVTGNGNIKLGFKNINTSLEAGEIKVFKTSKKG